MKKLKYILLNIAIICILSPCAFAQGASFFVENKILQIQTPSSVKSAVFKRYNDVWIVFSRKNLHYSYDLEELKKFGVIDFEKLQVKNGAGIRLRFNRDLSVTAQHDYNQQKQVIQIGLDLVPHNVIHEYLEVKDVEKDVKELLLDYTYVLDYAYSHTTGEFYNVAISRSLNLVYPEFSNSNGLKFLPTVSGAAFVSESGRFINILDESKVQISDVREVVHESLNSDQDKQLSEFFKLTGISLIEKQFRDYSTIFNSAKNYKAKGDLEIALGNISAALKGIDGIDYFNRLKQEGNQRAFAGLDSINIEYGIVSDLSGKDKLIIEKENLGTTVQILQKKEPLSIEDILVPDLTGQDLRALDKKLRIDSIKTTNSVEKEEIAIKRMQMQAFKQYFYEVIALSKMVKLDISGEYPKHPKALALYAMAASLTSRCNSINGLEEPADYLFVKDFKLWRAVCWTQKKQYSQASWAFQQEQERMTTYPTYLYNILKLYQAIALQGTDKLEESIIILKSIKDSANQPLKDEISYNIALSTLYLDKAEQAEQLFKDLIFSNNFIVRYKARLEYLNLLLYKQGIDKQSIIKGLEKLRFNYRKDEVELNATKLLASIYLQKNEVKKAMDLYKYINIYFPSTTSAEQSTDIMFNIFSSLFSEQKSQYDLSLISKLGVFYDFIELTPNDYKGNAIVNNVVNELIKLDLFSSAIDLLTIQLNYKLKNKSLIAQVGEKLASLYVKTQQYDNAQKVLKITQNSKSPDSYSDSAKLDYAKILLNKGEEQQSIDLLKSMKDNIQAKYILTELYWHKNNYQEIIKILAPIFLGKKVKLNEEGVINIGYLLLSYALEKDVDKIKSIKSLYLPELKTVDLEYKIDFLLRIAGDKTKASEKDKKLLDIWQKVLVTDSKVQDFIQTYNNQVKQRELLRK